MDNNEDGNSSNDVQNEDKQSEEVQTYGFKPMSEPVIDEAKKREREESEASKTLKKEILKMVSRYPMLELRTSQAIMEKLNTMSEDELQTIRDNCLTDLAELRGTPVASFTIFLMTQPVDQYLLPGYTDQCLSDIELKRDVENEIVSIMGELSNRINIFFRLLNNAYVTWKRRKIGTDPWESHASRTAQEPHKESNPSNDNEENTTPIRNRESPW